MDDVVLLFVIMVVELFAKDVVEAFVEDVVVAFDVFTDEAVPGPTQLDSYHCRSGDR